MAASLAHRGPDDHGVWTDDEAGIALGHQRLAIIDLSPRGHQPMASASGRFVIAYNGEIYNFGGLRERLAAEGCRFQGNSDTEVALAAIETWGLERAIKEFIGMFAFALWDRRQRSLHLVRDRLGIKPLYYGWCGASLVFGSELGALRAHPEFEGRVCREAVSLCLQCGYIPAPQTIFRETYKVLPGTILTVANPVADRKIRTRTYWSAEKLAAESLESGHAAEDSEVETELDALLADAVRLRLVSDVPLGAFLSGGLDSSTVVALIQRQSRHPVRTFSVGFREEGYDERPWAKAVAGHLGTEHTELDVSFQQARELIPQIPEIYDEPFADSSQIPAVLMSRLAREHVTVTLSGDGGDEMFGGYDRYYAIDKIWRQFGWLPREARVAAAFLLRAVPITCWEKMLTVARGGLPAVLTRPDAAGKIHDLAEVLSKTSFPSMYKDMVAYWPSPEKLLGNGDAPPSGLDFSNVGAGIGSAAQRAMFIDGLIYLPDDLLVKIDRASMSVGLENRLPLIDHRVYEFALRLPLSFKLRGGKSKWILRKVLARYLPETMFDRPKRGLNVPIGDWLRGPLRDWAETLLEERALRHNGFTNPEPVRAAWRAQIEGKRDRSKQLWSVLMLQAWFDRHGIGL